MGAYRVKLFLFADNNWSVTDWEKENKQINMQKTPTKQKNPQTTHTPQQQKHHPPSQKWKQNQITPEVYLTEVNGECKINSSAFFVCLTFQLQEWFWLQGK